MFLADTDFNKTSTERKKQIKTAYQGVRVGLAEARRSTARYFG
jgi:hypothetical protein